jgi:hypothetical protein
MREHIESLIIGLSTRRRRARTVPRRLRPRQARTTYVALRTGGEPAAAR